MARLPWSLRFTVPAIFYETAPRTVAASAVELVSFAHVGIGLGAALVLMLFVALAGLSALLWHGLSPLVRSGKRRVAPAEAPVEHVSVSVSSRGRSRALQARLEVAAAKRGESAEAVARVLSRSPRLSHEELARRAGVSMELARFHRARFARLGVIRE